MPNWQKFDNTSVSWGLLEEPAVTITKRSVLSMNAAAHRDLGSPTYVELLFDREERIIGVRPASLLDPGALQVWFPSGKTSPAQVSVGRFLKYFGIPVADTLRRPAAMDDGVLCVDLNHPGVPVGRSSRATEA